MSLEARRARGRPCGVPGVNKEQHSVSGAAYRAQGEALRLFKLGSRRRPRQAIALNSRCLLVWQRRTARVRIRSPKRYGGSGSARQTTSRIFVRNHAADNVLSRHVWGREFTLGRPPAFSFS